MKHVALSALLTATLTTGCTYGQVTWGGDPVSGVEVKINDCNYDSWYATTSATGHYSFDGYADPSQVIPEGIILIRVTLADGTRRYEFRGVEYTPCPDDSGNVCQQHDINLGWKPQTAWEWPVWREGNRAHNDEQTNLFTDWCGWP